MSKDLRLKIGWVLVVLGGMCVLTAAPIGFVGLNADMVFRSMLVLGSIVFTGGMVFIATAI